MAIVREIVRKRCSKANRSKRPIILQALPSIRAQLRYSVHDDLITAMKFTLDGRAIVVLPEYRYRKLFKLARTAFAKDGDLVLLLKERRLRDH